MNSIEISKEPLNSVTENQAVFTLVSTWPSSAQDTITAAVGWANKAEDIDMPFGDDISYNSDIHGGPGRWVSVDAHGFPSQDASDNIKVRFASELLFLIEQVLPQ